MVKLTNLRKWFIKSFGHKRIFIKSSDKTIRIMIRPYQQIILVFCLIISGIWIVLSTSFLTIDQSFSESSSKNDILTNNSYQDRLNSLAKERNKKEIETNQILQQFHTAILEISKNQSISIETRKKNEELERALKSFQEIINKPKNRSQGDKSRKISLNSDATMKTIQFLSQALEEKSEKQISVIQENERLKKKIMDLKHSALVSTERSERIFFRL